MSGIRGLRGIDKVKEAIKSKREVIRLESRLLSNEGGIEVSRLRKESIEVMQWGLKVMGYEVGEIDGVVGERTRRGWIEFKEREYLSGRNIGEGSVEVMFNRVMEIMGVKEGRAEVIESIDIAAAGVKEVVRVIENGCRSIRLGMKEQIAYILATVEHETGGLFKPVLEAYWMSEEWRRQNLRYWPYVGRGYVQITWSTNYKKYSELLGVDLVKKPDFALEPEIAMFILLHGCKTGTYTGKKIEDYINKDRVDFVNARRVINGLDRASHIAGLAQKWVDKLV